MSKRKFIFISALIIITVLAGSIYSLVHVYLAEKLLYAVVHMVCAFGNISGFALMLKDFIKILQAEKGESK